MVSHNVVFVVDVDSAVSHDNQQLLKRAANRILLHLGCKFGLETVRWGFKLFHSLSGGGANVASRRSDFREVKHKAFEDFELEVISKANTRRNTCASSNQASQWVPSIQKALKETLLDFQWDRPDITSPTKLALRPRKLSRPTRTVSHDDELSVKSKNVVFLLCECPHSKIDLERLVTPSNEEAMKDVAELILPKGLRDMMVHNQVMLHWVDTSQYSKVLASVDHAGYEMMCGALSQSGGTVLPLGPLLSLSSSDDQTGRDRLSWIHGFPVDSSLGYLLASRHLYNITFPLQEGILHWGAECCSVSLELVSTSPNACPGPISIHLKGVLQKCGLDWLRDEALGCWLLQRRHRDSAGDEDGAFHLLLKQLSIHGLLMFADFSEGGSVYTAVFSPLSTSAALLYVLRPKIDHLKDVLSPDLVSMAIEMPFPDLPDIVSSVLNVVYDIMEDEDDACPGQVESSHMPEWTQQELNHSASLSSGLVEPWFLQSGQTGVSADLMETMRLLHAVPEVEEVQEEGEEAWMDVTQSLSELYQGTTTEVPAEQRGKKRGAQRTPVRQKMKTMSRSLQMLNVARLNVKAQKSQVEEAQGTDRGPEKRGKRRCGDKGKSRSNVPRFSSEDELVSHLKLCCQNVVDQRDASVVTEVPNLLALVKTFLKGTPDMESRSSLLVQQNLLKSGKSLRQSYEKVPDTEGKVRECQLQAFLRLEVCKWPPPDTDQEQLVEEMTDMLRIISLAKDPIHLSKFLEEDVIPMYLAHIPRVLADVYHSLGTRLPEVLANVLPAEFFSDESLVQESVSSAASQDPASASGQGLEELRSAKKRRSGMLTRHRSTSDATQTLRQIEIPRKSLRIGSAKPLLPEEPPKQPVQEVTKVRRNLFNHGTVSPRKKAKMSRSRSVSAVEGSRNRHLKPKDISDHRTLLTKKVTETPLHKQVSNRLLQRQRLGRKSDPSDVCIVEESPFKPLSEVRRSPRIKSLSLTRRHSFYSSCQPRSRNMERALSSSQISLSSPSGAVHIGSIRSPMRLLFGEAQSPGHKAGGQRLDSATGDVFESPTRTPSRTPRKRRRSSGGSTPTRRSPRFSFVVGETGTVLQGAAFPSPSHATPHKNSPARTLETLQTPAKLTSCLTPCKVVTWSPLRWNSAVEEMEGVFKVPESPRLMKTPSKAHGTPNKLYLHTPDRQTRMPPTLTPQKTPEGSMRTPSPRRGASMGSNRTPGVSPGPPVLTRMCALTPRRSPRNKGVTPKKVHFLSEEEPSTSSTFVASPLCENSTIENDQLPHHVGLDWSVVSETDSSQNTEEDSMDIAEATVVSTRLSTGIKMSISFSRKPSKSNPPAQTRTYGLRSTPERQQRAAEARNSAPHMSTPCTPDSYQVELEMQPSGLPKLKFRRTDSFNAADVGLEFERKPPKLESPLSKSGLQTLIRPSYTPTRPPSSTPSPSRTDSAPWTPSPRSTPENLNSWPRRKRARLDPSAGKEPSVQRWRPFLEEGGEDPEVDGVCRLRDLDPMDVSSGIRLMKRKSCEDGDLTELSSCEKTGWFLEDNPTLQGTTPTSKTHKPVSASGILALTQSPLLYRGKTSSPSEGRSNQEGSEGSPFSLATRRTTTCKSYSRKRLL